ncbi:hypothetical protein [Candidatus Pantoea soli]|uniref:Apea-like HEPN domain-containing protein n=1 Tax=Candidatus Pantoea soli TaxID=3098669 RepID=A0A518XJC6_9GAMM|nr:hypothetical protein [Pantoea soli]QDY44285.1 hypothetical protein D8B20_20340 [Pantoea soli]
MTDKIYRSVIHMGSMMAGYFRYRDVFQIYPGPVNNQSEHGQPVIIEYNERYRLPPKDGEEERINIFGEGYGHLDLLQEITALLQLITSCLTWVPSDGMSVRPGPQKRIEAFSTPDSRYPLRFSEARILNRMNAGPEFVSLQSQAVALLDSYFGMDTDTRERINASLFLHQKMRRLILNSASMGFVGLISSIENLVFFEGERQGFVVEKCKNCGQPRYSVTRRFRDFMEIYSEENFVREHNVRGYYHTEEEFVGEAAQELIKRFYDQRSLISHAGQILELDRSLSGFSMKEIRLLNEVETLTRIALFSYILKFNDPAKGCKSETDDQK